MKTVAARFTLTCVGLVVISLIFSGQSDAISPENILGMWLFDKEDGEIAEDSSENGNDGTIVGNPNRVEGKFGGALELNGATTYIDVLKSDSLSNYTDEVTCMAWVKYGAEPNSFNGMIIFTDTISSVPVNLYSRSVSSNLRFSSMNEKRDAEEPATFLFEDMGDWEDEWYHIAGTRNSSEMNIYVNGVKGASSKTSGNISKDPSSYLPAELALRIGGANAAYLVFKGIIDEVAILNVALSAAEIKNIMSKGLTEAFSAVSLSGKLVTAWAEIKTQ